MKKRYQVFVSSTYVKAERQKIIQALMLGYAKVLVILLVGLLIFSCAFSETNRLIKNKFADINAEDFRIKRQAILWENESSRYKQAIDNWERDMETYNKKAINFIKKLDNKQLEIYSGYEESVKNNILAKAELYLRKLKASMSNEQKIELFKFFDITESLEDRRKELNLKQTELTEQKRKIVNDYTKNEERREKLIRILSIYADQPYVPSPSSSTLTALQQSLQQWQQNIQQRQQRWQMYSINQSLSDIASALRGY